MPCRPAVFAVVAGLVLACLPAAAQEARPPNDLFANRMVLTGQTVSSTPVHVDAATRESREPGNTLSQTVWYSWTAPADGIVTLTADGSANRAQITVFTGDDLGTLVLIDEAQDTNHLGQDHSPVTFYVKEGFTYQICLGTFTQQETGVAVLNIVNKPTTITAPTVVAVPAEANDSFANAVALTDAVVSTFTYAMGATRETREPAGTGNQTVWWKWTAPADALVTMTTAGSDYDTADFRNVLTVFNGTTLTDLTVVASNAGTTAAVVFPTKAGVSYYVCVGSADTVDGGPSVEAVTTILNVSTAPLDFAAPVVAESLANANDNYGNAQDLGSLAAVAGFGFNANATVETLESSANGKHTLWWKWTAPDAGPLAVNTTGSSGSPKVNVYVGDTIGAAASVNALFSDDGNGGLRARVTAGTTYHFSLGSDDTGTLALNLNLTSGSTPATAAVSVAATTPSVVLGSGETGAFTINLSSPLAGDITVAYVVKGSGINGVDYAFLKGTVKIKAGRTSKVIKVVPQGDLQGADKKIVKLTLATGTGYTISTPGAVKVKILAP